MDEKHEKTPFDQIEPTTVDKDSPSVSFDPSRMIGIIKRKALIRDLAAAYHAECLTYCQELLELQRKWGEMYYTTTTHKLPQEDTRRETAARSLKRLKKAR